MRDRHFLNTTSQIKESFNESDDDIRNFFSIENQSRIGRLYTRYRNSETSLRRAFLFPQEKQGKRIKKCLPEQNIGKYL